MKKTYCDIPGCQEEAHEEVDVCHGYSLSTESNDKKTTYEPFEKPNLRKTDLCEKHFRAWCKATYGCFWKNEK